MTPEILTVSTREAAGGVHVVVPDGDVDHDSVRMLRDAVDAAWDDGHTRIVLDLALVTFCDSAGLSFFVEAHRRAGTRGGWFRLAAPHDTVRYVLDATNLARYLAVHPTVDEALGA